MARTIKEFPWYVVGTQDGVVYHQSSTKSGATNHARTLTRHHSIELAVMHRDTFQALNTAFSLTQLAPTTQEPTMRTYPIDFPLIQTDTLLGQRLREESGEFYEPHTAEDGSVTWHQIPDSVTDDDLAAVCGTCGCGPCACEQPPSCEECGAPTTPDLPICTSCLTPSYLRPACPRAEAYMDEQATWHSFWRKMRAEYEANTKHWTPKALVVGAALTLALISAPASAKLTTPEANAMRDALAPLVPAGCLLERVYEDYTGEAVCAGSYVLWLNGQDGTTDILPTPITSSASARTPTGSTTISASWTNPRDNGAGSNWAPRHAREETTMETTEVRNGEWVTTTLALSGPADDRAPEQMRFDALTERVARAIARAEDARSRIDRVDTAHYADLYAAMRAADAEASAIIATVRVLLGDEQAARMGALAQRLWAGI